jgi:hypothetical protein
MKKEESRSRQKRWERGENEMKNRKTSVSWQNNTVELSKREQVIIYRLRTGYTRATHRHMIEKTDTPNCPFCVVRLTFYGSAAKPATKETNEASSAQYGRREEKAARNWLNTSGRSVSFIGFRK